MIGEKFKNTGTIYAGITWDKMVEAADLKEDEFILVYSKDGWEKYDLHKLRKFYEDKALKEHRGEI